MDFSEQELIRRNSLQEIINLGIDPYPAEGFDVNATVEEIKQQYPNDNALFQEVSLAGRIMNRRIMGAASFAEIQDSTGRIQIYIKRDEVCPGEDKTMYNTVFKKLLDIDQSELRRIALRTTLGYDIKYSPRRRQDIDFVFVAAMPRQARLIRRAACCTPTPVCIMEPTMTAPDAWMRPGLPVLSGS